MGVIFTRRLTYVLNLCRRDAKYCQRGDAEAEQWPREGQERQSTGDVN